MKGAPGAECTGGVNPGRYSGAEGAEGAEEEGDGEPAEGDDEDEADDEPPDAFCVYQAGGA